MLTISHPALKNALEHYHKVVYTQLQVKEIKRKAIIRKQSIHVGIAVLVFAVLSYVVYQKTSEKYLTLAVAMAGLAYGTIVYQLALHKLRVETKSILIAGLTDALGWSFKSDVDEFLDFSLFVDNHLVPKSYDRLEFEDELRGEVRASDFTAIECHMQKRSTDSEGKTKWRTVFRGSLIEIDFYKKFKGRTLVLRDKGFLQAKKKSGLSRIGLVDPVFEKAFEAYGSDQVESRYILTPDFMQKLVDLEGSIDGNNIRFAFTDGKLLIAVETRNRYETGSMFKPLTDERRVQRFFNEFAALYHIIDSVADNPRLT